MPPLQNVILFATQNSARVVQYIWREKKKKKDIITEANIRYKLHTSGSDQMIENYI